MDQNTAAAIIIGIVAIFITIKEILRFRIKKEQIKADAMVRAEEIKAKNQLDLEKLIQQEKFGSSNFRHNADDTNNDEFINERRSHISDKI